MKFIIEKISTRLAIVLGVAALCLTPIAQAEEASTLDIFWGWVTGLFMPDTMGQEDGQLYSVTIENMLDREKFAPILVVGDADSGKIWVGEYVSSEAHTQFTTGNPGPLSGTLGGDQYLPGSLGVGESVSFEFRTDAKELRVTAMVHPDFVPDNYVTTVIDLSAGGSADIMRFDIGDDEERKTVEQVGDMPVGRISVTAK